MIQDFHREKDTCIFKTLTANRYLLKANPPLATVTFVPMAFNVFFFNIRAALKCLAYIRVLTLYKLDILVNKKFITSTFQLL